MKIKQKVTTTKEVEIDIEFPAYFKNHGNFIKCFNEARNVWIKEKDICHNFLGLDYIIEQNYQSSTPEEFNAAFESAINHINELNK